MINIVKGDMFKYITENDYIAHCISGDFELGAGIAKTINEKYGVRDILLSNPEYQKYKDGNGYVLCTGKVFNLVTKAKYYQKPSYYTISKAIYKLAEICHCRHIDTVHMPKIGCGLDKLSWNTVYSIIVKSFNEFGVNAVIYYL